MQTLYIKGNNFMNKFLKLSMISLSIIILCVACKKETPQETLNHKNELSPTKESQYVYQESIFKKRYEAAQKSIQNGIKPQSKAPSNPSENRFAIVSLDKEIYGIHAFAVLPVIERDLTDEEMLQLADGMGDISFDEMMDSKHSWMDTGALQIENRPYYWEERIKTYELNEQYCFGSKKPKKPLHFNEINNINPVCITMLHTNQENFSKYKVYPISPMTEEQLLQMIALKYPVPNEYIKPLKNEIKFEEVDEIVKNLVKKYSISDNEPQDIYASYSSTRYQIEKSITQGFLPLEAARWIVSLHFSEGYDYELIFNASDGSFLSWTRYPKDYFAKKEPVDFKLAVTAKKNTEHTIEDMKSSAEKYAKNIMSKDNIEIVPSDSYAPTFATIHLDGLPSIEAEGSIISFTLSTGDSCQVTVMKDDLSIQEFSFTKSLQ